MKKKNNDTKRRYPVNWIWTPLSFGALFLLTAGCDDGHYGIPPADYTSKEGQEGGGAVAGSLTTHNQDIEDVARVVFLGDSMTDGTLWPELLSEDLRMRFGDGTTFYNYAQAGAVIEDLRDEQLPRIDTASEETTLVLFTIGGNDALEVKGSSRETSLAHMESKMVMLDEVLAWLADPAHFPGGVFVIFTNIYDPTDGEGDFSNCGLFGGEDWPVVGELMPDINEAYEALANAWGFDMLDIFHLFAGHGFNHEDSTNPFYCNGCAPDCPCPLWFDLTCIHPNSLGHEALADAFFTVIAR
jgi:lysophospholipase L1-like esterase